MSEYVQEINSGWFCVKLSLVLLSPMLVGVYVFGVEDASLGDRLESGSYCVPQNKPIPKKVLDLGNGVTLELLFVPVGEFTMGTPEPEPIDEVFFVTQIWVGGAVCTIGIGVICTMIVFVVAHALRNKHLPQLSLARLLVLVVVGGAGLLGWLHRWHSQRGLADAKAKHEAAWVRYSEGRGIEEPSHQVSITAPFYIGRYEVTQRQYQQIIGVNPSRFKGGDLPVEMVSWHDAQAFCRRTRERTGAMVRLPTEAEWEYACRAGTNTVHNLGDSETDLVRAGWFVKNSNGMTHPVGEKVPNAWGIYDMHGNVWEWCEDWYGGYSGHEQMDPKGPSEGIGRVLRGGSWMDDAVNCSSASRNRASPHGRVPHDGFRIVVVLDARAQPDSNQTK